MVQFFSFSSVGDSLCREHQPAGSKQQIMDINESKRVANTDKPRPVPSPVHQCMQFWKRIRPSYWAWRCPCVPTSKFTCYIFGGSVHNAGRDIDAKGKVFKRVTKFIDEYQSASSDNPAPSQFLQSRFQRHWNYRRYTMMQMIESFQQTVYRGPPLPDVFLKKKTTSTRSFRTPFHFTLR